MRARRLLSPFSAGLCVATHTLPCPPGPALTRPSQAGTVVVSHLTSQTASTLAVLILLAVHLCANYCAVRAVRLATLNRQRASLVLSTLLSGPTGVQWAPRAPTPAAVAAQERIFETPDGALRWHGGPVLGRALVGVSMTELLQAGAQRAWLQRTLETGARRQHLIWWDPRTRTALIVLRESAAAIDQVVAWGHALLIAERWSRRTTAVDDEKREGDGVVAVERLIEETGRELDVALRQISVRLNDAGWDVSVACVETRPGMRLQPGKRTP